MKIVTKDISILYIIVITVIFSVVYFTMFRFIRYNVADTPNFINAAKILFGAKNLVDTQSRITKPFVLLFPGFLNFFFNVSITKVMLIQNTIFFCLSGIFFAKLLKVFELNTKKQFLGVFILYTIQPIAIHGFELINDIAGLFFSIFILYLYFNYKKKNELGFRNLLLISLSLSSGILSKESSGLAAIVIIVDSFLDYNKLRFVKISLTVAFSMIIVFLVQWTITRKFGVQNVVENIVEKYTINDSYIFKIEQIIHSFDMYWCYIVYGIYVTFMSKNLKYVNKLIFYSSLIIIPFLFVWPSVQDRTIAVAAPIFIITILCGLSEIRNTFLNSYLLFIAGFINILGSFLIYRFQIKHLLVLYYSSFCVVFGYFLILEYKKRIYSN